MKKSKIVFIVFSAVVIIAVCALLIFGKQGSEEPSTGGVGTTYPDTAPSAGTTTNNDFILDTRPTEGSLPEDLFPQATTVPSETVPSPPKEEAEELPATNGTFYLNYAPVFISIPIENGKPNYIFGFGVMRDGVDDYLYLNPTVESAQVQEYWNDAFQFMFTPHEGYVTTICSEARGDYSGAGYSTIQRAFDYGLPSSFIDSENPGTVWYMAENRIIGKGNYVHIDVLVFHLGRMVASLRIYVAQLSSGVYYIKGITNLNQLAEDMFSGESRFNLPESSLQTLMDMTRMYAYSDDAFHTHDGNGPESLKTTDFIIEYREAGQGTYFDYFAALESSFNIRSRTLYMDDPVIAVTIRFNHYYYHPGPMTFYYRALTGFQEGTFELIGVEPVDYYYLNTLSDYSYPGYSEN